jgi:hypothetical protein
VNHITAISSGGVPAFILATSGVDKKVKFWLAPEVRSTWVMEVVILVKTSFPRGKKESKKGEQEFKVA